MGVDSDQSYSEPSAREKYSDRAKVHEIGDQFASSLFENVRKSNNRYMIRVTAVGLVFI